MDNDTELCFGVRAANDLDVTPIGFVRGRWMNIPTHVWRTTSDERQGC